MKSRSDIRFVRQLPVLATFAVLMAVTFTFGVSGEVSRSERAVDREIKIAELFTRVPTRIQTSGTWILRREVPIPTGELGILGDSSHASVEYQRLGQRPAIRTTFFIVHCRDARSMNGHHPPICYPASGWELVGDVAEEVLRLSAAMELKLAGYVFVRGSQERTLTVVNGFLMPDVGAVRHLSEANAVAKTIRAAALGLTQFQFVFAGDVGMDQAMNWSKEILAGMPAGFFETLGMMDDASAASRIQTDGN